MTELDLLKRRVFETGLRVDALHGELLRQREALANCQACFDTFAVPIDAYLRPESRDPSERFRRRCRLCVFGETKSWQQPPRTTTPRSAKLFDLILALLGLLVTGVVIFKLVL